MFVGLRYGRRVVRVTESVNDIAPDGLVHKQAVSDDVEGLGPA